MFKYYLLLTFGMEDQPVSPETANFEEPALQPQASQYIAKSVSQAQAEKTKLERLKEFLTECKRVLRVTKKPDREEFRTIVKISGLGMLVIGVVGFLVSVIKELVF